VAAGSEIVVVGIRKNGKAWVGAVDEALHEPLKVKRTVEPPKVLEEVEISVLVENGSTPVPSSVDVELEVSPVPEAELEVLELVLRVTECVVLSPVSEGAKVLLLMKPPMLLLLDSPVLAMLDGPKLPLLVVGNRAEVPVPSGTDFVVLSPVPTGAVELFFAALVPNTLNDPVSLMVGDTAVPLPVAVVLLIAGNDAAEIFPDFGYGAPEAIAG
jgi:hypothetical protein